jgi:hypothetical protein
LTRPRAMGLAESAWVAKSTAADFPLNQNLEWKSAASLCFPRRRRSLIKKLGAKSDTHERQNFWARTITQKVNVVDEENIKDKLKTAVSLIALIKNKHWQQDGPDAGMSAVSCGND